jgi:phenylpyruvate tautomerase PptA (4-oxalocrotonate tautomerase family)
MPTYVCYAQQSRWTDAQRSQIAQGISQTHSRATGAPISLVQCMFRDVQKDRLFIGGRPAPEESIWVHGFIRAGRTTVIKSKILSGIRDCLTRTLDVSDTSVWIYLSELEHAVIVEFGRVLPDLGGEQEWIEGLAPALRDHLKALG